MTLKRTGRDYLDSARQLAARVAVNVDRIDAERQLPPELAGAIADEGLFRLLVPGSLGGAELDHPDFIKIVRLFAEVDASTAWCINQNNVFATDAARMPVETAREIWREERAVVANGPPSPETRAIPVDGGYRLTGRWNYSSGSNLATWMAARAPVEQPGQNRESPQNGDSPLMFLVPKSDVQMLDLWHVNGLRGTASFSFEIDELFVPEAHTYRESQPPHEDGPLYVIPKILLFATGFATIALAVARASLDSAIKLSGEKAPRGDPVLLRDQPHTQRLIGEGEAVLRSAEAYLLESSGKAWQSARENGVLTIEERIQVRLAATHAIRQASDVVNTAYSIQGSDAIFVSNAIQRRYQDMSVITQHIQGRLAHYDTAGQFFLGLEPRGMY